MKRYRISLTLLVATLLLMMLYSFPTTAATTVKPAQPIISSVKALNNTTVQVKWKAAKNAKQYELYVSVNNGAYKKLKTLTAVSFKHANLKQGSTYAYKVRSVNGTKKSAFSKIKKITLPKASGPMSWEDGTELTLRLEDFSLPLKFEYDGSNGTITELKFKKYHDKYDTIKYVCEIKGKFHPLILKNDDPYYDINLAFIRKDASAAATKYFIEIGNKMKNEPSIISFDVDSKGNFTCSRYLTGVIKYTDYDAVVLIGYYFDEGGA